MDVRGKVSVIIPVLNAEAFLADCIESMVAQTYTDWEIIICDDGSTDQSYSIATEMAASVAPGRIRVLQNDGNKGISFSRNKCLQAATGEFIAIQDADDISLGTRFETQVAFLRQNKDCGWCGSRMVNIDHEGAVLNTTPPVSSVPSKYDLVKKPPYNHGSVMFRKSVLIAAEGYKVSSYTMRDEDYDLWFRLHSLGYHGFNLDSPLYCQRVTKASYRRRSMNHRLNALRIRFNGYRAIGVQWWQYVFVLRPLIGGLIPKTILRHYHVHK